MLKPAGFIFHHKPLVLSISVPLPQLSRNHFKQAYLEINLILFNRAFSPGKCSQDWSLSVSRVSKITGGVEERIWIGAVVQAKEAISLIGHSSSRLLSIPIWKKTDICIVPVFFPNGEMEIRHVYMCKVLSSYSRLKKTQ